MDRDQLTLFEDNAEYDAFVDKFKPKKTTDDCYTPELVYQAAAMWVADEYGVDPTKFVRPFYPELDFMTYKYPEGCVVVDNPPFSLLSGIVRFYTARGIRFFLFAPALTLFTAPECPVCYLGVGADIVYENGAVVATSFVTNMDKYRLRTAPELRRAVQEASNEALRARRGGCQCGATEVHLPGRGADRCGHAAAVPIRGGAEHPAGAGRPRPCPGCPTRTRKGDFRRRILADTYSNRKTSGGGDGS